MNTEPNGNGAALNVLITFLTNSCARRGGEEEERPRRSYPPVTPMRDVDASGAKTLRRTGVARQSPDRAK
jgi:hypothetical protein